MRVRMRWVAVLSHSEGHAMKRILIAAATAALCIGQAAAQAETPEAGASAAMIDSDGNDVGTVTFTQTASGLLHIFIEMTDLPPGPRGFHIHETGQCNPEDGFDSAGGHFSVGDEEHGIHSEAGPHAGDLPNVHVGQDGILKVEYFTERLTLEEGAENSLLGGEGRAVIVHEGPDDYATDPTGEAGARIACGVIEPV
jgi:Cu-Zn family superoxide dismutase